MTVNSAGFPLGNGLPADVLPGPLQLCILSMTSDHSSLAEENKRPAPSNTVIWLVQIQIAQGSPKSPKHRISFV